MSWVYRNLLRPILFTQDAEQIHERTMRALQWVGRRELFCSAVESFFGSPELPSRVFGLHFPNPVGLAAGMDKHAQALPAWPAIGFGFTELGAVTWLPQPGNPAPRIFRAIPDEAIVNRMGFNTPGAEAIAETLAQWRTLGRWPAHPVGMNLGKSKVTPLGKAAEDYANSFRALKNHLDFFVVNVSSPNTPNLRELQDKSALSDILTAIQEVQNEKTNDPAPHQKPILVKVAPDLSFDALDDMLQLLESRHIAGVVATNTTISRPSASGSELSRIYSEAGGLSGRPLRARSTEVIHHLYRQTRGRLPIMGVGGIFNAADAWEKIVAGASLVQIYTGLVYEGPGTPRAIVTGLLEHLEQAGLAQIHDAVGLAHK